jgi:hypothetical protein
MSRIAPCRVTWWPTLLVPEGEPGSFDTWDELFARFARRMPFMGDGHPGWSAATFDPPRRALENVQQIHAACFDYDKGTTIAEARERWAGAYGLLHTTRSHTDEAHRFRVILPLARSVSPFEYAALWSRLAKRAGDVDQAPKDPSRFWYVPGAKGQQPYEAIRLEGRPLDPDVWLRQPEPKAPAPAVAPAMPSTDVERRAIAYLARMPAAIAGQGGHDATWRAAIALSRGFGLDEHTTLRLLLSEYNPRCEPPWSERELRHKAAQAGNANVPHGYLLEGDRDREREALRAQWTRDDEPAASPPPQSPPSDTRPVAERYGLVSMRELMEGIVEELNKPAPKPGACTGSADLNIAIGGFRPGHVTVFGAKRGWGKTSYGNLVVSRAVPNHRVLMFAGEDAAAIYGRRFLAMRANLNAMSLRDYQCDPSDWPRIMQAVADAPPNPFFTRVEGRPVEWIAQVIRDVAAEGPLDLVIVDYLQCLRTAAKLQDRRNEVTHIFRTLSDAIKGVNAAGLVFSQLKRTDRAEPEVEDLKESGDIEDGADHIMLGWKHEVRSGGRVNVERKVKLGKNKDGVEAAELSEVVMRWDNRTASFGWTPSDSGAADFQDDDDGRWP